MLNKILCIEDSRIMQNIYKRMIEKADFAEEVIAVHNTKEALDYYRNLLHSLNDGASPDYPFLIFLDLNIPDMGGWGFLNEFQKTYFSHFPETRIVILTAAVDPKEKEKSKEHDIVLDYLPKPLTFEMLADLKKKVQ